jgi:membrane protease YdiL (CAAX protease family)
MFFNGKPLSISLYIVGVLVIFLAVYVPYFVPLGAITGHLVVYGVPIAVVSVIFGKQIFSRAGKNNKTALKQGFGLFSSFYALGLFLSIAALTIILVFNSSATQLLEKTNPVLEVSPLVAWIMIAVSMLVIGPAEEYLFRGFMYGGLLSISKGRYWLPLAVVSSVLFASAHAYYALTYGVASPVFFIQLVCFGVAMAITYKWSGGNLVAPAIVHGLNDAVGFLGVATTRQVGLIAQGIFLAVGFVFAVSYVLLKKVRMDPNQTSSPPGQTEPLPPPPPVSGNI